MITPKITNLGYSNLWTDMSTILGYASNFQKLITKLFSNGEQGFAYDPNDLTILYQDVAGTIPVTAAGQHVGLMLDKSKGLLLGSNLIFNGSFSSDTSWNKGTGWTIAGGVASFNGSASFSNLGAVSLSSINGKWLRVELDLSNVGVSVTQVRVLVSGSLAATIPVSGAGKYSAIVMGGSTSSIGIQSQNGSGANYAFTLDNVSVKEAFGNHAYQTTSASRPILRKNAITGANYLDFDGSDDFLQTSNIDFTATDKVRLFAGVNVQLGANIGCVIELSTNVNGNNGSFGLFKGPSTIQWASNGTSVVVGAIYNSPVSPDVLTAKAFINDSVLTTRRNSLLVINDTRSQGTGNYGNYPLYIGRRGGTSLPLNGHLYGLIGIGRLTTDSETITLEKSIAKNTGVTLNV